MNTIKHFIIALFIFTIHLPCCFEKEFHGEYIIVKDEREDFEILLRELINAFGEQMSQKLDLWSAGYKGILGGKLNNVDLEFGTKRRAYLCRSS